MNRIYSYILCLCLFLHFNSVLSKPNTSYSDCLEMALVGFQVDDLDDMKECLELFASDDKMESCKELAFPADVCRWHRSVAILRLFYLELINGEREKALSLLKKAVDNEKLREYSNHLEMDDFELEVVLIEEWLLWESNYYSEIDLELMGAFYIERKATERGETK